MPRFFEKVDGNDICIAGENARHISKSLRMRAGEHITLCDNGVDYDCVIKSIGDTVLCEVVSKRKNTTEPSVSVTLFQCLPKSDKFDSVVQKAVEMGCGEIVPVLSRRCVSRPDEKSARKKIERYNKIALSACEQCGRGRIVNVGDITDFDKVISSLHDFDKTLFFYEGGGEKLDSSLLAGSDRIALFIGPEGGFDECEVEKMKAAGATVCSLGPRILRTETAPIAALAAVMLLTDNL